MKAWYYFQCPSSSGQYWSCSHRTHPLELNKVIFTDGDDSFFLIEIYLKRHQPAVERLPSMMFHSAQSQWRILVLAESWEGGVSRNNLTLTFSPSTMLRPSGDLFDGFNALQVNWLGLSSKSRCSRISLNGIWFEFSGAGLLELEYDWLTLVKLFVEFCTKVTLVFRG